MNRIRSLATGEKGDSAESMNQTLNELIDRFRAAQDIGVETLKKWKLPQPSANREWPFICIESKINHQTEIDGIGVYSHGYGIKLTIGTLTIDFDWGDNGEPDGFDAWRLYVFALNNFDKMTVSHESIQVWLDDSLAAGELTKSGSLYFDPTRRATSR
jgi:hypothetical protein